MHTFADPLRRAVQIAPTKTAIIAGAARFTFADFQNRCARLVGALRSLGLQHGDRVAILAANGNEYLETYVGVPAGGLVVVPLNTRHAESELEYALKDSGTKVLLTDRDPGMLGGAVDNVILIPDEYEPTLAAAEPVALGAGISEDDLAGLFYTGGTTGLSKGVMLSHRNLIANTFHWLSAARQREDDHFLIVAPLFHAAGSNAVLGCIWNTTCQTTLAAFDPDAALDLIEQRGITQLLVVPTMLAAMTESQHANPRNVDSLQFIAHGGSPVATEVLRRSHSAFPGARLIEVYGATELSPLATMLDGEEQLMDQPQARSCGRAIPGNEVRILNTEGEEVARGEVGEVVVRGPNVMQGYWNKPEQTEAVLKDSGYWTGDLGYMDAEGYLFLVDRSKDMIISGGENVYSTEVEEVLYKHPAVLEAAAFGVPDDKWGEAVWAAIVPRAEHGSVDAAKIIEFCKQHIAGYKVPKGVDIRQEPLPKSGPGKVLKRELRAPYWEGRRRGVN
ncbi:MAG: AMP-binding protein [Gammaproteobacteria bacterium]|jgi:long-chain acyl-CoA synthetase|nr:AMP-binding protein [Gammaproteobacteria bacterium]